MILVIKHIDIEGPGSMGEFFRNTCWHIKTQDSIQVDLSKRERLPGTLQDIEAIISFGGPMNVYEENKYPFLKEEDEFLKKALKEEVPILGICLGAQLLAKACGAKVKKAPQKEIGWHKVNLTESAKDDPLFENLPSELDVFQWHEDTFEIPKDGVLLAESEACPNQAFRFGSNAYGIQFHIEVTPDMVESWINEYMKGKDRGLETKDMIIEAYKKREAYQKQADLIYLNFSRIIREAKTYGAPACRQAGSEHKFYGRT
jgi:GMP synthase (glutamine-hydrolysing)